MQLSDMDRRGLRFALDAAVLSKDPSTRVGAAVADKQGNIIATGHNCFPQGVKNLDERWENRDLKLRFVCHAEAVALINAGGAARNGTLYCTQPPCCSGGCAQHAIQAGVTEVVCYVTEDYLSRWREDVEITTLMFREAGVLFKVIPQHD